MLARQPEGSHALRTLRLLLWQKAASISVSLRVSSSGVKPLQSVLLVNKHVNELERAGKVSSDLQNVPI